MNDPSLVIAPTGSDASAVVIGHLFSKHGRFERVTEITATAADALTRSNGKSLIENNWGGYVATWIDLDGTTIHVLRDPSGALPCLYAETATQLVFASDVDALFDAGVFKPIVDWDRLASHLLFSELRLEHTALKGVTELLPSVHLSIGPTATQKTALWSPWDHIQPNGLSPEDLRQVIDRTVGKWGSVFDRIALGVSGGLDSSVVAACLASKRNDLTCFTLATHDAEGDERSYARQLSNALDIRLFERFYDLDEVDITRTSARHLPRPILFAFGQSSLKARTEIAAEYDIDAFFTGIGGDNIFCSLYSATAVVDRFRSEGLTKGLFSTLIDVASLSEATIWEVLSATFRHGSATRIAPWHSETLLLSPDLVRHRHLDQSHPWLEQPAHVLPGKATHVSMFQRIQGTIDGFDRQRLPAQINPLLSQPVVEACLSIPSWQWCLNGENRSMARQAYKGRLPEAILRRRSKGGPGSFAHRVIEANRSALGELLIGGLLAEHELIDQQAVRQSLDDSRPLNAQTYWRLSELAEAEAWARYWAGRRARVVRGPMCLCNTAT